MSKGRWLDARGARGRIVRTGLVAGAVVLALNAAFLLSLLATSIVPSDLIRDRIVTAFDDGSLSPSNRLPWNRSIGWHQYNDCLILQMISNDDRPLSRALGPIVYHQEDSWDMCGHLSELAQNPGIGEEFEMFRYTRYWHGHNVVTTAVVAIMPFAHGRTLFRVVAYLSALAVLVAGLSRGGGAGLLGVVTGTIAFTFWGFPYFAQSPSHGPGDATVLLGLAALILFGPRLRRPGSWAVACAAFGSLIVFMEFLTGLLPTAAALLLPLGFLVARDRAVGNGADEGDRVAWVNSVAGIAGFSCGVGMTVVLKQFLALLAFGPDALRSFGSNLSFYVDTPGGGAVGRGLATLHGLVRQVADWGAIMTYGSRWLMAVWLGLGLIAWLGAAGLVLFHRGRTSPGAGPGGLLACGLGAGLILLWIALLPMHWTGHSFMVRILMAPVVLGWTALLLQVVGLRTRARREKAPKTTG